MPGTDSNRSLLDDVADQIAKDNPPRFVLYLDVLGFGNLVLQHPQSQDFHITNNRITGGGLSHSEVVMDQFQSVLNRVSGDTRYLANLSHMMIFSDCAVLVFFEAFDAAHCAATLMRQFIQAVIPVRMGLGYGTWHLQRSSFDVSRGTVITRALFYGSGVVCAARAERCGGKGCRVFIHPSVTVDARGFKSYGGETLRVMPMACRTDDAHAELNYLESEEFDKHGVSTDLRLLHGLSVLQSHPRVPLTSHATLHRAESVRAIESMRVQLGRGESQQST